MNPQIITRYLDELDPREGPACAYLYDLNHLRTRAAGLVTALPEDCDLYYAIKANSDAPVLQALLGVTAGFEVASLGEIERVRAVDANVSIVFGGPGKTDAELEGALRLGVRLMHVESELQLRRLDRIAQRMGQRVDVLLRVNPTYGLPGATLQMGGRPTQFGIDEAELPAVIALARCLPGVRLVGLHLHAGSNSLEADNHLELIARHLALAQQCRDQHGLALEWLNVGGGIGIDYANPARSFDWPRFCAGLAQLLRERRPGCRIVLECGRFISADCGCYVAEVIDLKRNHGKHFAIVRGGTHHFRLPVSWQHDHPFFVAPNDAWPYPFARPEFTDAKLTICGELCTPKDVFAQEVAVPCVRVGDRIVFMLAGAYGWHISHHDFLSHPHPDRVFVGQ
ncbi:type III PLP-dependent enzyme [Cupriavidus sp. TMH.W2]|uniref:type III PLP-dependent enzyme n=1 Tax=Cupriavidus sp. TMH.W2 TaxID=3434465 RepID=UPI003D76EEA7